MKIKTRRYKKGYDQLMLRLTAIAAMIIHSARLFAASYPVIHEGLGMFSIAIFAWMLAEGCEKSSDRYIYARRLLLFALLAEVPYDLLNYGYCVSSHGQNAIFTLLLALCCFWLIDVLKEKADNAVLSIVIDLSVFAAAAVIASVTNMQGGIMAIICAFAFHISRSLSYPRLFQTAVILPCAAMFAPQVLPFIAAAMLLCWAYNGERGANSLGLRYLFYASYPLVLLACWYLNKQI